MLVILLCLHKTVTSQMKEENKK